MSGKTGWQRAALFAGTTGLSEVYRGVRKGIDMVKPAGASSSSYQQQPQEAPAAQQERLTAYEEGKKRVVANRRLLTGEVKTAGAGTTLLK